MTPILFRITRGAADIAAGMVGGLLGLAFEGVAPLRGERPLHSDGITCAATVRTRGGGSSGVPWLDERGTTPVTLRVSRAIGLPGAWSDIYGVAVRNRTPTENPPARLGRTCSSRLPATRHTAALCCNCATARRADP